MSEKTIVNIIYTVVGLVFILWLANYLDFFEPKKEPKPSVSCDQLVYKNDLAYINTSLSDKEELILYTGNCYLTVPYSTTSGGVTVSFPSEVAGKMYHWKDYDNGELLSAIFYPIHISDYSVWGLAETYIGPKNRTTNKNNGLYRKYRLEAGKSMSEMEIELQVECDGNSFINCKKQFSPESAESYYNEIVIKFFM